MLEQVSSWAILSPILSGILIVNDSITGVLFYSALVDVRLSKADVLLVLTKMDLAYRQMRNEAMLIMNLKKIKEQSKQNITIVETSAVAQTGLDKVLEWLFK